MIWQDEDCIGAEVILVPFDKKGDLIAAVDLGLFEEKSTNVFILSIQCDDINLINNIFSESDSQKPTCEDKFIFDTIDLIGKKKFESAFLNLQKRKPKSRIEAYLIKAVKEYAYSIYFIYDKLFNQGLFGCEQKWIDGDISIKNDLERAFNSREYTVCPIQSLVINNKKKLLKIFSDYEKATRIRKLKFLSAYFLVASCFFKDICHFDISLLYLHRAIETLLISWCLEDNLLNINSEGSVDKDKYIYLKGYLDIIKGSRAISDSEVEAIDKLNKARNNNKFTHGYTFIDEALLSSFFNDIKRSITGDPDTNELIKLINESINFECDLYKFSRNFLIKKMFVESYKF